MCKYADDIYDFECRMFDFGCKLFSGRYRPGGCSGLLSHFLNSVKNCVYYAVGSVLLNSFGCSACSKVFRFSKTEHHRFCAGKINKSKRIRTNGPLIRYYLLKAIFAKLISSVLFFIVFLI
jgi:hypothetical protein